MRQVGAGMVEMLLASFLSAILLLCLTEFFVNFRHIHQLIDEQIQRQEKTQIIDGVLRRVNYQAGFVGCRKLSNELPINQDGVNPAERIAVTSQKEVFSKDNPPDFIHAKPVGNVQVFRYLSIKTATLLAMPEANKIVVSNGSKFKAGELIGVADCQHFYLLHVTKVSRSTVKQTQTLTLSENINSIFVWAQVAPMVTVAFYQAINSRGKKVWYEDLLGRGKEEIV